MGKSIYDALLSVQKEITNPANTAINPFFKSKYAPLPDILNQVRPLLAKHNLILLQNTGSTEDGTPFIQTKIIYAGASTGEPNKLESDKLILNPDKKGVQGIGSAITYGRRYQLSAMLGISSEDDNDGNGNGNTPPTQGNAAAKNNPPSPGKKSPKTSKTGSKKKPKSAMKTSETKDKTNWKKLAEKSSALKKVCDLLVNGGFDLDEHTVWIEAGSMQQNGHITEKELDEIEILLEKKAA
jgi:hypothetical protein